MSVFTKTRSVRLWLLLLASTFGFFQAQAQSRLAFMHGADDNSGAGSGVSMWISNGDGTFKTCKISDTGFDRDNTASEVFGDDGSSATFYVDVTGDGVVDIVHASEYSSTNGIYVYKGNGRGSFSKTVIATTGMQSGTDGYVFAGQSAGESSFMGDVNGDGKLDYVTSGNDDKIHVYFGNGNGTFATTRVTTTLTGANGYQTSGTSTAEVAFLADVNGDGKADLVETNEADGRSMRVWLATTLGNFNPTPVTTMNFQQTGSSQFTGIGGNETSGMIDINGDGKLDFVHTNEFDANIDIFTFLGNGDGTFATTYVRSVIDNPTGTYFQVIGDYSGEYGQWIDVTGDGKVDFVTSADNLGANSGIYVYKGNGDGSFVATPIVTLACGGFQTGNDFTETTRIVQAFSAGTTFANNCRVTPIGTTTAPGGVSDLLLWLKADDLLSTTEGAKLTSWSDSLSWGSVGNNNAYYYPTYNKTTASKLINFNPSVSFDGTDELKTDHRLYCANSQFQLVSVALDERTSTGQLRAPLGIGSDGNYPAMDLQTDGISPNGWNPWMSGSSPAEWGAGTGVLYNGNTGGTNQQPQIFSLGSTNASTSATDNILSWVDGKKDATTLDANQQTNIGDGLFLGSSGGEQWVGRIPETLIYTRQLNDGEMRKVNSYLAIKYGVTLNQTTAQNYLASDSSILWNATTNAAYKSDIAVIGRDDASSLNQKQSKSVNIGIQPIISLAAIAATNVANTGSLTANKSFEAIGHNGLVANYATSYSPATFSPVAPFYRMNRIWKVQETGTVGTVTIGIPLSNGAERLLVSSSATFTPASTQEILLTNDGNGNLTATVDLTDGQFFTFGRIATAPGGVVANIATWLRADAGIIASDSTAISTWADQSVIGYDVAQATATKQPIWYNKTASKLVNFNPSVYFDGTDDVMINSNPLFAGTSPFSFTMVGVDESTTTGYRKIFGAESPVDYFGLYKVTGATANNGWSLYVVGNNDVKGTGYAPTGGASGYWNGTTFVADAKMQRIQPQVIGINSANPANTNPSTFKSSIDGYASTGTFAGITAYQNNMFKSLSIGGEPSVEFWKGRVPEFVAYSRQLTDLETQRVNTYMAIKYGVTLGQGGSLANIGNNAANYDYIASDGTTKIWDATANSTYKYDITGIGKDAAEDLNQKQSRSINASTYVTMALGTSVAASNGANTASFGADRSYEVIGDNGSPARFATAYTPSFATNGLFFYSMSRVWKVQETGTVGTVTISIPSSNKNTYLLVKNSASFASGATEIPMVKDGNGNLTATVDFTNGQYFTFATALIAPGAVVNSIATWLKADAGVIDGGTLPADGAGIDTWNDQSFTAAGYSVSQATANKQPLYYSKDTSKLVNFNPSVYFDGSNDVLANSTPMFAGTSPFSFMMVGVDESTVTGYRKIFGAEDPVDYFGLYKVLGATSNNGWSLYTAGNNDVKGTGYAPTGGASGYWNGTAFVADNKMKVIQPQIIGISSANPLNTNPSTFKSTIDGYASTGTFNGNSVVQSFFAKSLSIGAEPSGVEPWLGRIPEFVAYSKQLTDAETQRVNTYMAIKYGITLGQGGSLAGIGNNAANYDYIATDGTTKVWDATANSTYKYDITGIGRDDAEGLDQEQSKSMNASVYVTMALGNSIASTNSANTNSFAADKSYEIFGDNGLAASYATVYIPTTFTSTAPFYLMSRIWKVQETGTVGTVTLSVPGGILGAERLLVSSTAAFGSGTQEIALTPDGNGNLTAQVDFTNGQFFTFGRALIAPGGVVSNLNMWLKADALTGTNGSKVTTWSDAFLSTYSVDQATAAQQPTLYTSAPTNLVNFNPSVKFDNSAAQTLRNNAASPLTATGTSYHFIAVAKDQENQNLGSPNYGSNRIRAILGNGASGDNPAMDLQKDGASFNGWNPWTSNTGEFNGGKATMYNGGGVGNASGTGTLVLPSANVTRLINQQPQVIGLGYTAGAATKVNGWIDGFTEATNLTNNTVAYTGGSFFGLGHSGGGEYWNGTINEVMAYSRELTALEMQKINTYTAIKYGITLGQGNGNVGLNVGYNYVATDGVTNLWNTTTNTGFNYDIAVIGRDDAEALNQKQSQSVNSGIQPIIGLGAIAVSNQANANAFATDKAFEAWGSNGLGTGYSTAYTPTSFTPTFPFKRMDKAWKVQETSTVGPVTVKINSNADYLLVDTDGDGNFATGTITEVALTNKQASFDFKTGDVFTFGREVIVQTCSNGLAFIHGDDAANSSNSSALGMSAWVSNGDGTFKTTPIVRTGFNRDGTGTEVFGQDGISATYTADVDNDGDKDLIHATENNSNSIYVYLNNGDGTFQTTPVVTTGMQAATNGTFAGEDGAQQGWMGDANGDGNIDYIFSGDDKQIHVYLGNGDGTFALTRISSTLVANGYNTSGISGSESFLIADVNNDGSVDLVGSFDPQHMTVWLGNGDGTFQASPYFDSDIQDSGSSNSSGSAGSEYSQFADVDGDGDLDYLHAEGYDSTPQIWAYLNNGDGTFATTAVLTQATTSPAGDIGKFANYTGSRLSYFADVNNDGKADFVTTVDDGTAAQNGIYVYLATSNGSFAVTPIATVIPTGFATGSNSTETSFIACGVILCNAGTAAPSVPATKTNVCPATTANLSSIVPTNSPGNTVTTWHTGTPATLSNRVSDSTAVGAGVYYAAFLDKINGCLSPTSTAITVTINSCNATFTFNCASASATGTFAANGTTGQTGTLTIGLTGTVGGPATFNVTGTGFTGTLTTTLTTGQTSVAIPITYDGTGAPRTQTLTVAAVAGSTGTCTPSVSVICGAGAASPNLAATTLTNVCPTTTANLTTIAVGNKPSGITMTWHTATPATTANKVADATAVATGTYYAAFYDATNSCYSGATSGTATTAVSVTMDVCPADISVSNVCPSNKVDLTTRINSTVPAGKAVTWHTGLPTTAANKVGNPAAVMNGTYYAAFYDSVNDCYSPGSSNGIVVSITLCQTSRSGVVPPTMSATTLSNVCPATVADLSTLTANNTPVGATLTWHSGSTADNTNIISSITAVGAGTYYSAFYDDLANTYSPTTAVTVTITTCVTCEAGYAKPELSATTKSNTCPATTANLGTITSSYLPVGATLSWHSATPATLANKVADSSAVAAGTYHAAFYDALNGCFSGGGDSTTAVVVTINSCSTPDLITVIGQPTPTLTVGQTSSLPIKVQNIGGISAPGLITTTITLPIGTSAPATFTTNGSTCATVGQTVTCTNAGPIAANDSIIILVPVTPNASIIGTNPIFNAVTNPVIGETVTANNTATPTPTTVSVAAAAIKLSAKVFLSGSYVTLAGMMHDSLRVKGLIPSAQPYSSMGYTGTETVAPSVLTVTGANAIVDWVLVELRSDATTVVAKRAGLVQRDGDIVDTDGVTPLTFTAASGSYYVVVRHRNHLGVMSGSAIALSPTTTTVDFTSLLTTNYQVSGSFGSIYAQRTLGSVRGLWGGNSGGGVNIKATGSGSDAEAVYFKVLLDAGNTSFSPSYIIYNIYAREDATMDGKIIYQGTDSEVDGILFNVLLHLNNAGVLPTFVIYEQIP